MNCDVITSWGRVYHSHLTPAWNCRNLISDAVKQSIIILSHCYFLANIFHFSVTIFPRNDPHVSLFIHYLPLKWKICLHEFQNNKKKMKNGKSIFSFYLKNWKLIVCHFQARSGNGIYLQNAQEVFQCHQETGNLNAEIQHWPIQI